MANRKKTIIALMVVLAGLMLPGCGPSRREFYEAVKAGNLIEMQSILAKRPELVNRDNDSYKSETPLGIAAASGNIEVVEFLIDKGADINGRWRGYLGEGPLHSAAAGGHKQVVELLVAKGADVNASPLDYAEEKGHKEIADILRKQAKAVEDIFNAVNEGNLNKVKSILEEKPELMLNTSYKGNHTLLHQAVIDGRKDIAEFLIDRGACIYARNNRGDTPLDSAVKAGHKGLVELLLNKGADASLIGLDDYAPLHYAVEKPDIEIIKLLISEGADINARTGRSSDSPLDIATIKGYADIVKLLLANGAKVNSTDHEGWTALFFAAREGHKEIAELLIANGADVNAKEKKGYINSRSADTGKMRRLLVTNCESPLHKAARYGHKEIVEVLIANGAKVNARAVDYVTPLHVAAEDGDEEIVEILLENGAKVNAKTRKSEAVGRIYPVGATPLDLAKTYKIAKLLVAKGAKTNRKDMLALEIVFAAEEGDLRTVQSILSGDPKLANANDGYGHAPLHAAIMNGHKEIVKLLIDKGADVNAKGASALPISIGFYKAGKKIDMDSRTFIWKMPHWRPLHFAAAANYTDIADLLLAEGAEVNNKDDNGDTPLDIAVQRGHKEIAELLRKHGAVENADNNQND